MIHWHLEFKTGMLIEDSPAPAQLIMDKWNELPSVRPDGGSRCLGTHTEVYSDSLVTNMAFDDVETPMLIALIMGAGASPCAWVAMDEEPCDCDLPGRAETVEFTGQKGPALPRLPSAVLSTPQNLA